MPTPIEVIRQAAREVRSPTGPLSQEELAEERAKGPIPGFELVNVPRRVEPPEPLRDLPVEPLPVATVSKKEIDFLKKALKDYENQKRRLDLSPLIALTDSWTGSRLLAAYDKPPSSEERQALVLGMKEKIGRLEARKDHERQQMKLGLERIKTQRMRRQKGMTGQEKRVERQLLTDSRKSLRYLNSLNLGTDVEDPRAQNVRMTHEMVLEEAQKMVMDPRNMAQGMTIPQAYTYILDQEIKAAEEEQ